MLEDGTVYNGEARGKFKETVCEIVFNTSMTGYVETLTDPSYVGQGVVMTYPLIGNYGVCEQDFESNKLQPSAFLVHELCDTPSNFRCEMTLEELLIKHDIPCVAGLDTREIVMHLRENGTMRGIITDDISDKDALLSKIKAFNIEKPVESVTTDKPFVLSDSGETKIALIDFGALKSLGDSLIKRGCAVTQYPAFTTAEEIIKAAPDGVVLSNGAGNPADYTEIVNEVKKLYDYGMPIFGIGFGHQLVALANGGEIAKMKYGHRGANQPVKFVDDGATYLTSQNHGYEVTGKGLPENAEIRCVNVNDKGIEGIVYHGKPVFTIQFNPGTNCGPRGTAFLFDKFIEIVKGGKFDA